MSTKKGRNKGKSKLTLCSSQKEGGNEPEKKIITVTCLYCSRTYQTDDPENFRMPKHPMLNNKHNTPCNGSGSNKKDFSWLGKYPKVAQRPQRQFTL